MSEVIIVNNVRDRRFDWVGSWKAEPLDVSRLTEADVGRTVIYRDFGRAEAGTLSSWKGGSVWARFSQGDTADACDPADLLLAIGTLDGDPKRLVQHDASADTQEPGQ